MYTFKYPITIGNQDYYVEKTVDGHPAVYRGVQFVHQGRISEEKLSVHNKLSVTPGTIIIIAKRPMDLQQKYFDETGHMPEKEPGHWTDNYVAWLEDKCNKLSNQPDATESKAIKTKYSWY